MSQGNGRQSSCWWIVEKAMFCETGTWSERIVIAVVMAVVGALGLCGLYLTRLMAPGWGRGCVAWLCFTIFFAKAINLCTCGGPIASGIVGVVVIGALETFVR